MNKRVAASSLLSMPLGALMMRALLTTSGFIK